MLQISNFKKYYGQNLALEVENLIIPAGIHWFKGINGSGKSTFFKCLAGMLPFEGEIILEDSENILENILDIRKDAVEYRLRVNYSEAEPLFPDFLRGSDLLNFIAEAKRADAAQISQLIDTLQVSDYLENPIGTYSSGMLKKFSLLLAFLGKPKLIMLDEPLITIDTAAVQRVYDLIKHYHHDLGVSFLLSSHQDFKFEQLKIDSTFLVENRKIIPQN
jgi:ABC-2 type transport system ATP-binding protein